MADYFCDDECIFRECSSKRRDLQQLPFFDLPTGPLRHKWLHFCDKENTSVLKETQKVCALHFRPEFWNKETKRLKKNAVPTLMPISKNIALDFDVSDMKPPKLVAMPAYCGILPDTVVLPDVVEYETLEEQLLQVQNAMGDVTPNMYRVRNETLEHNLEGKIPEDTHMPSNAKSKTTTKYRIFKTKNTINRINFENITIKRPNKNKNSLFAISFDKKKEPSPRRLVFYPKFTYKINSRLKIQATEQKPENRIVENEQKEFTYKSDLVMSETATKEFKNLKTENPLRQILDENSNQHSKLSSAVQELKNSEKTPHEEVKLQAAVEKESNSKVENFKAETANKNGVTQPHSDPPVNTNKKSKIARSCKLVKKWLKSCVDPTAYEADENLFLKCAKQSEVDEERLEEIYKLIDAVGDSISQCSSNGSSIMFIED